MKNDEVTLYQRCKKNTVLTVSLEADWIDSIVKEQNLDIYVIKGEMNKEKSIWLFDLRQGIIDNGQIKLLGNGMYKKSVERRSHGDPFDDVSFIQLIKNEDSGKYDKKVVYADTEFHGTTNCYLPNVRFDYKGDDIIIKSSPNLGNDQQGRSSDYLGFAQAMNIKTGERGPEYPGTLIFVDKDMYAHRLQIMTDYDKTAIVPYLQFVTFDGTEITKKPYYDIKKLGNMLFAKPINASCLTSSDPGNKGYPAPSDKIIEEQYHSSRNPMQDRDAWIIIDPITFDPINDEVFVTVKKKDSFIVGTKQNNTIVIYDTTGNRKAEDIVDYKDFDNGELYECNVIGGGKRYYDKNWNELKL